MHQADVNVPKVFMVTIVNKHSSDKIIKFFQDLGILCQIIAMGKGTAGSHILEYLGLATIDRELIFSMMPLEQSVSLLDKLDSENYLDKKGRGIAFTIPVSGFTHGKNQTCVVTNGGNHMDPKYQHELIIAITNRGFSDLVMDAARLADATGGTIIHARESDIRNTEKFFGIKIQPEKELIMIVAENEISQNIMKSISEKAGIQTEANTIIFSLPVAGIAGLNTDGFLEAENLIH